jgi:hypothetical protein
MVSWSGLAGAGVVDPMLSATIDSLLLVTFAAICQYGCSFLTKAAHLHFRAGFTLENRFG